MFIVVFHGGFANQLFQYAFYLKLKEVFPTQKVYADISHYKRCKDHGGFKLDSFVKLHYVNKKWFKNLITINEKTYEQTFFSDEANYCFNGYWQEEKFFPKDIQKIKRIFNTDNLNSKNKAIFESIINNNSISVHVRRGDYVDNFMHGNIANQCYLQNSINYVKCAVDNPHFFVFSDDIDWAKNNLIFSNSNVTFVSGNLDKVEQDIILMSNCRHNIISNSTFSWWAQNLNPNPDKIVISPEYWFNQKPETVKELFVDNSVRIPNTPFVREKIRQPFFSILIPVYNTEKTLRRTLASVLNQTFKDIEVIIVDDGSTDNSFEILKTYESRDIRIKLFKHEKNFGLLAARYTAMKEAVGKYVLFIDSDDWFELGACQILYNELQKNPVDMLEFGYIREPLGLKQKIGKDFGNRLCALLQNNYMITFWNKAYSMNIVKKVLASINSFRCTFSEDFFYSIVFACFARSIGYVDCYLTHYTLFTGISTQKSYSNGQVKEIIDNIFAVKKNLLSFLSYYAPDKKQYFEICMKARYSHLAFIISKNNNFYDVLGQLQIIDSAFDTDFHNEMLKQIQDFKSIYEKYQNFLNIPYTKMVYISLKFLCKTFIDRVRLLFNLKRI